MEGVRVLHVRSAPLKTLPKNKAGTSLVVQWLRLHAPNAGGLGSIPGQGTRSHMLQLRPCADKINKNK